jgi:hypothetical protein
MRGNPPPCMLWWRVRCPEIPCPRWSLCHRCGLQLGWHRGTRQNTSLLRAKCSESASLRCVREERLAQNFDRTGRRLLVECGRMHVKCLKYPYLHTVVQPQLLRSILKRPDRSYDILRKDRQKDFRSISYDHIYRYVKFCVDQHCVNNDFDGTPTPLHLYNASSPFIVISDAICYLPSTRPPSPEACPKTSLR